MPNTMQLHVAVTKFVKNSDQIISGLCKRPCSIKQSAPIPIIRKVGSAMSSVLRVRIVRTACGR